MDKSVYKNICDMVGMIVSHDCAERAVMDLLPCIGRTRRHAVKHPKIIAREITEYLDDVAANP